jgi:hypothetical protein
MKKNTIFLFKKRLHWMSLRHNFFLKSYVKNLYLYHLSLLFIRKNNFLFGRIRALQINKDAI